MWFDKRSIGQLTCPSCNFIVDAQVSQEILAVKIDIPTRKKVAEEDHAYNQTVQLLN